MTDFEVRASRHARRRFKERAKLPVRAAKRMAEIALRDGLAPDDPRLSPPLQAKIRRTIQNNVENGSLCSTYRVYGPNLYIFSEVGTLITVLAGFDDPDQAGKHVKSSGHRWLRGEIQIFKNGRRPRPSDHFSDEGYGDDE